ncbi:mitochondrial inner membrane protease ATP23 homolog isoform X2 [Anabrus simplex]|uniref:mitochondrial inner membrane protease ATP23 homolog isoform X2 n=1 Tax=Anabrus simplex TaxID=316456 RepID=UPI0035A2DA9E
MKPRAFVYKSSKKFNLLIVIVVRCFVKNFERNKAMADDSNNTQKGFGEENSRNDSDSQQTRPAPPYDEDSYGYGLFPERRGEPYKPSWSGVLFRGEGKEQYDKIRCERNVYSCVKNSPLVKLMLGALKASGCEIDIRRHIACEVCDSSVSGGYDPVLNQVVICQNVARKEGIVQGSLTHEFIHMFDYCENKLDFKNLDHLACTEIRAANLAHCSFISACLQGDASPMNIKKMHQISDLFVGLEQDTHSISLLI